MKELKEQLKEIIIEHYDAESKAADEITALINDNYVPVEFVEWLIHNTMEATTYSPLVYLKYQTKQEIIDHGGQWFDLSKEWHISDLLQYWKEQIRDK